MTLGHVDENIRSASYRKGGRARRSRNALVGLTAMVAFAAACGGRSSRVEDDATDEDPPGGAHSDQGERGGQGATSGGSSGGQADDPGAGQAGRSRDSGGAGSGPGIECSDQDASGIGRDPRAYAARGMTRGRNGSFQDYCDEDGNLIEHYCPVDRCFVNDCGANDDALAEVIACPTGCREGACFTWCPDPGDTLGVTSIADELLTLHHDSGQELVCAVAWTKDGYDCTAPDLVGVGLVVQGTTACEPVFRVSVDDPMANIGEMHECELLCHAVP